MNIELKGMFKQIGRDVLAAAISSVVIIGARRLIHRIAKKVLTPLYRRLHDLTDGQEEFFNPCDSDNEDFRRRTDHGVPWESYEWMDDFHGRSASAPDPTPA